TMDLDRLLNGTEVAGNLFVQFASDDIFEHFPLTRCERGQARADFGKFGLLPPTGAVFLNGRTNGCKQVFVVDRLGEEITRAVFHCLHGFWNISGTGQKDNGQETACFGQDMLKLKAIKGRHREVEHETAEYLWIILREEFLCGCKRSHNKASRVQHARDGSPYRRVIVHNKYRGSRSSHEPIALLVITISPSDPPIGRLKWNVAPRSALFVAHSFPRCAAIMVWQTERPRPIPLGFVVKKGSKICSIFSSGILPPRSVTDTSTAPFPFPFSVPVRMSNRRSGAVQSTIASQ